MPIYRQQGEAIEAKQILLIFERRISEKTEGFFTESVVEGNPAQALIKTVWKYTGS